MSIGKIRYPNGRVYLCDDCKKTAFKFKNEQAALAAGWAVAHGRKNVWCPSCAPRHRNTGRGGAPLPPVPQPSWVPAGWKQETIEDIAK